MRLQKPASRNQTHGSSDANTMLFIFVGSSHKHGRPFIYNFTKFKIFPFDFC